MKKYLKIIWLIVGIIYFPFYVFCWVLHKIARLVTAIAFLGMLEKKIAKNILESLFKWHGRY